MSDSTNQPPEGGAASPEQPPLVLLRNPVGAGDDAARTARDGAPASPGQSSPPAARPELRIVDPRPMEERTRPPSTALRFASPELLFAGLPEVTELTMQRPRAGEDGLDFLLRLRASTTPEEAVTYTAFAALPERAAGWGYECLRCMADHLNPMERPMMEMIAAWLAHPGTATRHRVMKEALYAPSRSPSVLLGLAVGWSSGGPAPNDSLRAPEWRTPQAINSAVLSCLARADLSRRPIYLARFIDMAEALFREY
ncbi:MAG: hypothetical protein Q4G25_00965 [Paracoccus sp. (in: a-proteobacteria)]|nr:hypothetical protein [Paracoccus sp. (in: a-proteobacteria)]